MMPKPPTKLSQRQRRAQQQAQQQATTPVAAAEEQQPGGSGENEQQRQDTGGGGSGTDGDDDDRRQGNDDDEQRQPPQQQRAPPTGVQRQEADDDKGERHSGKQEDDDEEEELLQQEQQRMFASPEVQTLAFGRLWNAVILYFYDAHRISKDELQRFSYKIRSSPSTATVATGGGSDSVSSSPSSSSASSAAASSAAATSAGPVPSYLHGEITGYPDLSKPPASRDVRHYLIRFVNNVRMPAKPRKHIAVAEMQPLTVVTPVGNEKIMYSYEYITRADNTQSSFLQHVISSQPDDWENFKNKEFVSSKQKDWVTRLEKDIMQGVTPDVVPRRGKRRWIHDTLEGQQTKLKLVQWASLRFQALYRTVHGFMLIATALQILARLQNPRLSQAAAEQLVRRKFSYVVGLQNFGSQLRLYKLSKAKARSGGDEALTPAEQEAHEAVAAVKQLMQLWPTLRIAFPDRLVDDDQQQQHQQEQQQDHEQQPPVQPHHHERQPQQATGSRASSNNNNSSSRPAAVSAAAAQAVPPVPPGAAAVDDDDDDRLLLSAAAVAAAGIIDTADRDLDHHQQQQQQQHEAQRHHDHRHDGHGGRGVAADGGGSSSSSRATYVARLCSNGSDCVPPVRLFGPFTDLGLGKPVHQNFLTQFVDGNFVQTIDVNQANVLAQSFFVPNVLAEFDADKQVKIIGCPEFVITTHWSSTAWCSAFSEHTFGTLVQRVYARLGIRLHYGHPDFLDALWVMTETGLSKLPYVSEDIFTGFDTVLKGGRVGHIEYHEVGKARDVDLTTTTKFIRKISMGGSQLACSRYIRQLQSCVHVSFFQRLAYYYSTVGFYLNHLMLYLSVWFALTSQVLIVILQRFVTAEGISSYIAGRVFVFQVGLALVIPGLLQLILERGLFVGLWKYLVHVLMLSVYSTFHILNIAGFWQYGMTRSAFYLPSGRGSGLEHYFMKDMFDTFYKTHWRAGFLILWMGLLVLILTGNFLVFCIMYCLPAGIWLWGAIFLNPGSLPSTVHEEQWKRLMNRDMAEAEDIIRAHIGLHVYRPPPRGPWLLRVFLHIGRAVKRLVQLVHWLYHSVNFWLHLRVVRLIAVLVIGWNYVFRARIPTYIFTDERRRHLSWDEGGTLRSLRDGGGGGGAIRNKQHQHQHYHHHHHMNNTVELDLPRRRLLPPQPAAAAVALAGHHHHQQRHVINSSSSSSSSAAHNSATGSALPRSNAASSAFSSVATAASGGAEISPRSLPMPAPRNGDKSPAAAAPAAAALLSSRKLPPPPLIKVPAKPLPPRPSLSHGRALASDAAVAT